jgi:hypothetical protein
VTIIHHVKFGVVMSRTHPLQIVIGRKFPADRFTPANKKPSLSKAEALQLVKKISRASTFLFENVVLLIAKGGHRVLGFAKPQYCLRQKIPTISNSYICRLLQATEIFLKVDPDMEYLNLVSESTFRPLQHISDKDCKAVWNWVLNNTVGYRRITSRDVNRRMDALNIMSHENCVSPHQTGITVRIDQELIPKFRRHIERIRDALADSNINSADEWKQIAKIIYLQIVKRYRDPNSQSNSSVMKR